MSESVASKFLIVMGSIGVFCALAGCGGSTPSVSKPPAPCPEPARSNKEKEIGLLLADIMQPLLCPQLRDTLVGLPLDSASFPSIDGPKAGLVPTAGRWWLRQCAAKFDSQNMMLSISGPGWTWVDREQSGFRVKQYVFFEAEAQMRAAFDIGYDASKKVASLWLKPQDDVQSTVRPLNAVTVQSTNVISSVVGGVMGAIGKSVDQQAKSGVEAEGSQRMKDQLARGFTLTLDLNRRQIDFMSGALKPGETPERPYAPDPTFNWLVNQRSWINPGGFDLVGPIAAQKPGAIFEVELEEGEGAMIGALCVAGLEPVAMQIKEGRAVTLPQGDLLAQVTSTQRTTRVDFVKALRQRDCPTVLAIVPLPSATLPARLRYRLLEGTTAAPLVTPVAAQSWRMQVVSATVRPSNPKGSAWDIVGGEADVFVSLSSVSAQRALWKTNVIQDRNDAVFSQWVPFTIEDKLFPLRFTVIDEDSAQDEIIGFAELDVASALRGGDFALPIRANDGHATLVGTLNLRLERAVPSNAPQH